MLIKLKEREKFRFNLFFGKILKEEYDVNKDYKILRQCTKNQFLKIYSLTLSLTHNLLTYYPEYSFYPFPSCEGIWYSERTKFRVFLLYSSLYFLRYPIYESGEERVAGKFHLNLFTSIHYCCMISATKVRPNLCCRIFG